MSATSLSWLGILRIGLVQAGLGAIVVLTTSTMNRLMVVELALPAALPAALVGLHYAIQIVRPRLGFGSDVGGRRTTWIVGGMGVLAIGGIGAALAITLMRASLLAGLSLAIVAFALIGLGVGACGTSLLVLLAKRVDERKRPAAATAVWLMMIVGFVVTTILVGHFLDPYTPSRLLRITTVVCLSAFIITALAVRNVEGRDASAVEADATAPAANPSFRQALAQVWAEPSARQFTVFVFVSMLAYSAQELILEPFAGTVFGFTPGQSTQLTGMQHGGSLMGMLLVAFVCSRFRGRRLGSLPAWTVAGCFASSAALLGIIAAAWVKPMLPLRPLVFALGMANGAFAVAAVGSMMTFAGQGRESREGVRMGLWGAAQATAFGLGGFLGAAASDLARHLMSMDGMAYALVFAAESGLFMLGALLASRLGRPVNANVQGQPLLLQQQLATTAGNRL